MLSVLLATPSAAEPPGPPTAADPPGDPTKVSTDDAGDVFRTTGKGTGLWVVELEEPALASYTGGVDGFAPTSPQVTGAQRLDVDAPASEAYRDHLEERQADARAAIDEALDRSVDVAYTYQNVINGLAVQVDDDEAEELASLPGVTAVYRDVERELATDVSHDLISSASIWTGETGDDTGTRGEGVLVGVIDSGVNPDHPSFAATDGEGYEHTNPFGSGTYLGVCSPDHPDHQDICNDKLVGAYNLHPASPDARDADNHGSHTASTIAGNLHEATVQVGGETFTRTVQGVAPRANLISYLVCYPSCPTTSSVAAVEQAVTDGVDVLNFSISGGKDPWRDLVDRAFLDAFNAGIFVAAAAGNDGPGAGTVAHTGPWNAAVAATTHYRGFVTTLDVTGPAPVPDELTGLRAAPGSGPDHAADIEAPIRAAAVVAPGNDAGCRAFPEGAFDGAVALIDRATCAYSVKVDNAAAAGAVAVVVVDATAGPPVPMGGLEDTTVPAVMIERDAGAALRTFLTDHDDAVTVRLGNTTELVDDHEWEDIVAGFSSRGPGGLDMLAPTFAAPGVNVLAAGMGPDGAADRYVVLSGTSMASPHGAGAGALLTALHPDWSPAQITSALASSADPDIRAEDGTSTADAYDVGSGRLDLGGAGRIGLVMDESYADFLAADPAIGGDPSSLNLPSFVDTTCVESCSWTRTVENVSAVAATYTADVTAPEGVSITVEPQEFTIEPGATQTVEVTATVDLSATTADQPAFADIALSTSAVHDNGRPVTPVHYPVVVTPRTPVPPTAVLTPTNITAAQGVDDVASHTVSIGNGGNTDLTWQLDEGTAPEAEHCAAPGDVAWLTVAPHSGTVTPDATGKLEVTVDSTGMSPGTLSATLCLRTNDPDKELSVVDVVVTILGDSGADENALYTELVADGLSDDQVGEAVAIDGDTAVVGAFLTDVDETANVGAAYVYTRTDGGWQYRTTLLPPAEDRDIGVLFGSSVAVDGDTVVVGAPGASTAESKPGAAYVFTRDGDTWAYQAKLTTDEVRRGGNLGKAVAIDGDTVAVGAPDDHVGDNNVQGVVYAFERDGDTWSPGQRIVAAEGSSFANFGTSIAVDGDTVVIGSPNMTIGGQFRQGAVYVFTRADDGWAEQRILTPSDAAPEVAFGTSVDLDEGTIVVGASGPALDFLVSHGSAYVFTGADAQWAEQAKLAPTDAHVNNRFGTSVAIDGDAVVVGAPYQGQTAGVDLQKGSAVVFTRDGDGWTQQRKLVAKTTAQGDHLGTSVDVSGGDVIVGAPDADSGDTARQGTAYVFVPGSDAPADPAIEVSPGELAAEVTPGESTTQQLSLSNPGGGELSWEIEAESTVSGRLRPAGPATVAETPANTTALAPDQDEATDGWAVQPGPDVLRTQPGDRPSTDGDSADPSQPADGADSVRLTHSASMEIGAAAAPVCTNNLTGTSRENRFLRTFTLTDFGVEGAFDVSEVTFGVHLVTPKAELTVNLYTMGGAFEYMELSRLATTTVSLQTLEPKLVTVPLEARVPAGATMVLEVVAPDMEGVGYISPGVNSAGQSAPSYISAPDCSAPNPVTIESIGFPEAHLVMAVDGTPLEPVHCELPSWLGVAQRSGTVAPGQTGTVEVTLDAAELDEGTHTAHLCIASNDPATPITTVPVSLVVAAGSDEPELDVETRVSGGIWYADLTWTGLSAEQVDIERDGLTVATVANTGEHTDMVGRPRRGESFTYRVCAAGTEVCSDPVTVYPRGEIRDP